MKQWQEIVQEASQLHIQAHPDNQPVTIRGAAEKLVCVGIGTDAAVFQHMEAPQYALKMYAEDRGYKSRLEEEVYQLLGGSPYFPTCFGRSGPVLVLSFEEGTTFFDCLLQGIVIPEEAVNMVEKAREYVRSCGLNPRDIHLKNILLQPEGTVKVIDVSEFIVAGDDLRWEHLLRGYQEYYAYIQGRPLPHWLLETVRRWYNRRHEDFDSYDDFVRSVLKWTKMRRPPDKR
ncbi:serine/threonine protein kinase [Alkalicoccus urumqiensis]|uniref:Serine/threonine protein kinase n=1 Tax=Alkalicoccus urumqiensis TaxID=1548213 RepID=A0A2P6MIS6_ALKUR|nr:serine/threonine protein kinase [Alkalicoccus urumqiensis]PRO66168.1 serine/threonine protein kinase [Alkalicoccus urumqiensis]